MQNRTNPSKSLKTLLVSLLLCCALFSCAFIPEQEQLVSLRTDTQLTRSNGSCTEQSALLNSLKETPQPELSPESISIFDWNIYKGQRENWDVDLLLLSYGKDIILLQEAALTEELQDVLEQKDMSWNLNSAFKYNGVDTGVLVASSTPVLDSCGIRHSEPLIGLPKTILVNRYGISESTEELLVANIHGINISLGTAAYQAQLAELEKVLEKHDGPIVLAGDFNNWSDKRTEIMLDLAERLSLQNVNFEEGKRTLFFGEPVDQIFYRGLEPLSQAVYPVNSSDHNPISVTFRLIRTKAIASRN